MTSPFGIEVAPVAEPTTLPDTFTVDVTDEDIQLGAPGGDRCAIHRAVKRELFLRHGFGGGVGVGFSTLRLEGQRHYIHNGALFVAKFDSHLPVKPQQVTFTRRP